MNVRWVEAVVAGLVGTAVMTAMMLMAPMMGMPPMNIGEMLGSMMGGVTALGWAAHFMIGAIFGVVYAGIFDARLPGPAAARGMMFSLLPWLAAQTMVMPMMGAGFFSGSALAAGGSLMGHLLFGAAMGSVYARGGSAEHAHAIA